MLCSSNRGPINAASATILQEDLEGSPNMAWSAPEGWLTRLFSGDPVVIGLAFLISILLPLLVHLYFYATSKAASETPSFVLLGPTGAGKTSLLNLLQSAGDDETMKSAPTRVSQMPSPPVTLTLPPSIPIGSNKYRSKNDDSSLASTPYQLIDTPGHGKLRAMQAMRFLSQQSLRGVVFMVDAASLESADSPESRDAATYLHDVLLELQKRKSKKGQKSKVSTAIPVLVAANKQDLFTALPPGAVRQRLETEIERVRHSRTHGLVTVGEKADDEPDEALGGDGEKKFSFKMLKEEHDISVEVIGGAVAGEEAGKGVRRWEEWIASCL